MPISFVAAKSVPDDVDAVIVPVFTGPTVPEATAHLLDVAHLRASGFTGKPGTTHSVPGPNGTTVIGVGLGDNEKLTVDDVRNGAAVAARAARRFARVGTTIGNAPATLDPKAIGQAMAEGVVLGTYKFTKLKKPGEVDALTSFTVAGGPKARVQAGLDRGARIAEAVVWARDRVNEPAGHMNPTDLANAAAALAKASPALSATSWDDKKIEKEGLGALRGVSLGSSAPPRLIRLAYEPAGAKKTLIFVGKGITFDSGGLSLKSGDGMMAMKTDMAGGAAVLAAVAACADLGVKHRVIGIVPATENLPGPSAIKPGDVLTARNGTTIEVLNTDAEGRLVLADGLSLAVEEKPAAIVDLATLTGAAPIALGRRIAALMGNHAEFTEKVKRAASSAGELVWELPLPAMYRKHIDSEVADLQNIGRPGQAGTIIGGLFLKEFVGDTPWVHLDIAGPSRIDEADGEYVKGASGFGVRTLIELASSFR